MRSGDRLPADLAARLNGHRPHTFTAADLMAQELPEPAWIVSDILTEGVALLAGKPKLGKSWMALGLCVAVASGGYALGTKAVEEGGALYLALEDNARRLQKRLRQMLPDGVAPPDLHYALDWPRMDEGGAEKLDEWLSEHPGTRLVCIDTLKKVRPRTSGNRTLYELDYEALEPLIPVAAAHGVAIVVVHHSRKAGADDPLDEISGSTGLTGGVDGVLVMKRERGRADAYLHVDGRDIENPAELALRWDAELSGWRIVGDAEEYRMSEERREIVRVLEEHGQSMTPTEVADALGKSTNTVKLRLWRMSKDGQLENKGGRYQISCNPGNSVTGVPENPSAKGNPGEEPVTGTQKPCNPTSVRQTPHENGTNPTPGYRVTPVTGFSDGKLTAEQVQEVRRLVREGMSEEMARLEVLGNGHAWDCLCAECLPV